MITLTDDLIRNAFDKLGIDEKFFPFFDKEIREGLNQSWLSLPEDEDATKEDLEEENRVLSIILDIASKRTIIFATEIEKGHSETWANSYAEQALDEEEFNIVLYAYNSIDDREQRDKELDIHVNSLSDDIIFRDRYKKLFHEFEFDLHEKALKFCELYHQCIKGGKSEIYSHAFADKMNSYEGNRHFNHVAEIYADAYEQAIKNGMDDEQAYQFGSFFIYISDEDSWFTSIIHFLNEYHEDWQKELYLYLALKDYKHYRKNDMPELEVDELKKELYQIKSFDDNDRIPPFDFPDEVDDTRRHKKRTSSRDELLDMMFDRDEDFNDDDDGIGGILSK